MLAMPCRRRPWEPPVVATWLLRRCLLLCRWARRWAAVQAVEAAVGEPTPAPDKRPLATRGRLHRQMLCHG